MAQLTKRPALTSLQRSGGSSGAASVEDKSKMMLDDIMDKLPEAFDLIDINDKLQVT
eukprot:COSAG01_NODE_36968_length_510_cov_0.751825_1_plen_57_part_00